MRRLAALSALLAMLAFAACGDDDEDATSTTSGATGASGASGTEESSGGTDLTAGEFVDGAILDQQKAVKDAVAAHPDECADADPESGGSLQIAVAIAASTAPPDTPIEDLVLDECG